MSIMNDPANDANRGIKTGDAHQALPPAILVTTDAGLQQFLEAVRGQPAVAVDTESNSLFAYYPRVCLIQVSFPGADYVIDPLLLDVDPLDGIFGDPAYQKVFHAAENDILGLKRDFGFSFANIFDTMIAARILGWQHAGLAAILETQFNVALDKKMQRTDWGRRPLDAKQLAYARLDTHFLLALKERQESELRERRRWEEARETFDRLPGLEYQTREFDPDGFWSVPGARDLSPTGLAVLRELYVYRDNQASREDRPSFKVIDNHAMLRVAATLPATVQELDSKSSLAPSVVRHYGSGIIGAVKRGLRAQPPIHRRASGNGRPDPRVSDRHDALRKWRTERARLRGVDPDVVLTNEQLLTVARLAPASLSELMDSGAMGPWKAREYGPEILDLLARIG